MWMELYTCSSVSKAIADPPDRFNFVAHGTELLAQARDVVVNRAIEAFVAVAPDLL